MRRWTIDPNARNWQQSPDFAAAVSLLRDGQLVAVPTETVYGLAADATNARACAAIYEVKGRPQFNPLISHVESLEAAERHGQFEPKARQLAEALWPGALTLVVPKREASPVSDLVTAGLDTIALRVPAAAIMRDLAEASGRPLAAPSANRSGRISATTAEAVIAELGGGIAMVIDGGETPVGVESTIVALTGGHARLLRPGGIPRAQIEAVLGEPLVGPDRPADTAPEAPGMLSSHYAPSAAVRPNATEILPGEALLAFGPALPESAHRAIAVENLSPSGDLVEAAARLFSSLRRLDASGAGTIAVMPVPEDGLGEAINDRLRRAAAPRG